MKETLMNGILCFVAFRTNINGESALVTFSKVPLKLTKTCKSSNWIEDTEHTSNIVYKSKAREKIPIKFQNCRYCLSDFTDSLIAHEILYQQYIKR